MLQIIISAIRNREFISFSYSGLQRIAQPATVGISRTGNNVLRCYQTEGGHITAGHKWDMCEVSKISSLKTTGKTFSTNPPGYKKGDQHMNQIYAEL